jgi:hypothetical protein
MARRERGFRKWLAEACDPKCAGAGLFIGVLLGQILTVSIQQHNRHPPLMPAAARAAAQQPVQPAPARRAAAERPTIAAARANPPQIGW